MPQGFSSTQTTTAIGDGYRRTVTRNRSYREYTPEELRTESGHRIGAPIADRVSHEVEVTIRNLATDQFVILPGYIESLSEALVGEWAPEDFFGKSESVYIYKKGDRDISFSMKILVEDGRDVDAFKWTRRFFHSCTRPTYDDDGNFKSSPICKLKIGKSFDHHVIFNSINISYDPLVWDLNTDGAYPMFMSVDFTVKVVHDEIPDAFNKFYPDSPEGTSIRFPGRRGLYRDTMDQYDFADGEEAEEIPVDDTVMETGTTTSRTEAMMNFSGYSSMFQFL